MPEHARALVLLLLLPAHAVILQVGTRVLGARYNLQTIARATRYMGTFGSNTQYPSVAAALASQVH